MIPSFIKGAPAGSAAKQSRGRLERLPPRASVATHRALFVDASERRCDLCEAVLAANDDEGGSGLYVWTRGSEVRYEEPPLCRGCGAGVSLSAMRRWELEDEEEG